MSLTAADEGKEVASEDEEVCEIRKVKGKWRASRQVPTHVYHYHAHYVTLPFSPPS